MRASAVEEFVIVDNGLSKLAGVGIFCKANIVADGGVFSPRIALGPDLALGRRLGMSRSKSLQVEVGVLDRVGLFSGDRVSYSRRGMRPNRSGERSGDLEFSR